MSLSFVEKRTLTKTVNAMVARLQGETLPFKEKRGVTRALNEAVAKLKGKITAQETPTLDKLLAGKYDDLTPIQFLAKLEQAVQELEGNVEPVKKPAISYIEKNDDKDPGQILESTNIEDEANKAATSPKNNLPEPTQAQKDSGTYKKGHISIAGLSIAIENPAGSKRSGVDPNGKEWAITMKHHYGYVKGSIGKDKDHVDVFVNPELDAEEIAALPVFVIDQVNQDGVFDEHKCIFGYQKSEEAKAAYLANYKKGWSGLGAITEIPMGQFKEWIADKSATGKPLAEKVGGSSAIFEAAAVRTPLTVQENIQRGTEAMKRVIRGRVNEPRAMFRKELGWIAFYWGSPGKIPPERNQFKTNDEMREWWEGLQNKYSLFKKGSGISHIVAKRNWEGRYIKGLKGQNGEQFALGLMKVIARGKVAKKTATRVTLKLGEIEAILSLSRYGRDEIWLLSGMKQLSGKDYDLIVESSGAGDTSQVTSYARHSFDWHHAMGAEDSIAICESSGEPGFSDYGAAYASPDFDCHQKMGAEDSISTAIILTAEADKVNHSPEDQILEKSSTPDNIESISKARSYKQLAIAFANIFQIVDLPGVATGPAAYKDATSDFGLKLRGKKTREKINDQVRGILEAANSLDDLSKEEIELLKQYSGRGGLTENSQYEYYTPTPIAEGLWDAMSANGFVNGNVLDPATGAGVFPATKPEGVVMTGADIDPVGSKISQLFNPDDSVTNSSFESLVAKVEDNTFDSAVGNVPFGDARGQSIFDDPAYKNEKRIERYFLLRALDKIKPGGLACFVVPINIVGAKGAGKWSEFRIALSKKAEFLGAHKLPSKAFGGQGTDTVVDIVVFKKHPQDLLDRIDDIDFSLLEETKVIFEEFIDGLYWKGEGKRFIQGKYVPKVDGERWSRETVDGDNRVISGVQHEMIDGHWVPVQETIDESMSIDKEKYGASTIEKLKNLLSTPETSLRLTHKQAFAAFKTWPDIVPAMVKEGVVFSMTQAKDLAEQTYRGSIIGGMIGRLKNAGDMLQEKRDRLQGLVTGEIEKYGHPKNNSKLRLAGESSRPFGVFLSSVDESGQFSGQLSGEDGNEESLGYNPDDVQSIVEHLFVREGIHTIELEDIQRLFTGGIKLKSLGDLAAVENIAVTPDGMIMPLGRYTSGDIYPKITAMTQAMALEQDQRLKDKWQQQINVIKEKRHLTDTEDISFGLQEKWFSPKYIVEFLKANGYPKVSYGRFEKYEEEDYQGEMVEKRRWIEDFDTVGGGYVGIQGSGFVNQFHKYLNGGNITSSKQEFIEEYKAEVATITENFNAWMQQHPDMDQVAAEYNRKFNAYLPHEYEDDDLEIEGMAKSIKLHGYQNAGIRRLSEEGRGVLGDDVGLGKTFSAIGLALYNKQMGRSKKTCIVVPDAVLSNWYHEINLLTGNMSNVLFVGVEPKTDKEGKAVRETVKDENGKDKINGITGEVENQDILVKKKSKEDVWEKMWEVTTTNKSIVVMTKEKFGSIPMKKASKERHIEKMVERDLISAKAGKKAVVDGKASYQDAKDKANKEAKYADEGTRKKGELPYYEEMGFTDVIIDEAHEFKNSYQAGKDTRGIAYLPTAPSSQRALDMVLKTEYLKEMNNGRGVYPLTATPVTNSVFEIYNMLSYVCPREEFERFGIHTVDDFVRVFGKIEQVDKVMVSGEIVQKDGLVGFRNLDGLRNLFHKYCILRNAKDVDLPLPPSEELNEESVMNDEQTDIYETLRSDAKEASKPKSGVSMFSVIRDMDRVTTDMDLYHKSITFHFLKKDKSKVQALMKELPATVERSATDENGKKYTEEVAVDIDLESKGDALVLVVPEEFETVVVTKLTRHGISENDVTHPLTPKYAKVVANLRKHLEAKGKQLIFTEEKSQHGKLKRILSHHVPLAQDVIGIINGTEASGPKLQKIADSYNSGRTKVVIANKKAEVGVNLQKGTTAIHHLTLPWTPASVQQRNGRGIRQGNKAKKIQVYYYLCAKSFDYYRLDLLKKKSNWIGDLFNGKDVEADNANAMSQDDMMYLLADDPEEAKRMQMEKLAKKQEARQIKEEARTVNLLRQLNNIVSTLGSLDKKREEKRSKLQQEIADHNRVIDGHRERGKSVEKGSEEYKTLGNKIFKRTRKLKKTEENLDSIDTAFDNQKTTLEAKVKQIKGTLNLKKKKGELPFEPSLIDHPENMVASLNGRILAVGEVYEIKRDDTTSETYKITNVHSDPKAVEVDIIVGNRYNGALPTAYVSRLKTNAVMVSDWPFGKVVKCSYSEQELQIKELLSEPVSYIQIPSLGSIDKTLFQEHIDDLTFTGSLVVVKAEHGNAYELLTAHVAENNRDRIVYPDFPDTDFRKRVALTLLSLQRQNGVLSYSEMGVAEAIFGATWEDEVYGHGKVATEREIREFFAKQVQEQAGVDLTWAQTEEIKRVGAESLGDNIKTIQSMLSECALAHNDEIHRKQNQAEQEEEKKKLEEVKNHPDYKEVPENLIKAFADLGLTAKTNLTDTVLDGRRYKDIELKPFERWFFQDENGKNGVLYNIKDILKSRYSAKFHFGKGGDFNGAWWHVSSKEDLEELYELMK